MSRRCCETWELAQEINVTLSEAKRFACESIGVVKGSLPYPIFFRHPRLVAQVRERSLRANLVLGTLLN